MRLELWQNDGTSYRGNTVVEVLKVWICSKIRLLFFFVGVATQVTLIPGTRHSVLRYLTGISFFYFIFILRWISKNKA